MRVVVVGASSGLGRCIAAHQGQRGNHVALLARRKDNLAEAAKEAGPDAVPIRCDVTDEASVPAAIDEAVTALGGIDAVVYATGMGTLSRLADVDAAMWRRTLDTNVVGASLVTAAAMPHILESHGVFAYLSSVQSSTMPPWPGLGSYAVSKAALDRLIEAWRNEYESVGFTRIVVGETAGGEGESMTQFASSWDPDLAVELGPIWLARHYMTGDLIDVTEIMQVVDMVLQCGATASIPSVTVTPRPLTQP